MTVPLLSVGDGLVDLFEIVEAREPVEPERSQAPADVSASGSSGIVTLGFGIPISPAAPSDRL